MSFRGKIEFHDEPSSEFKSAFHSAGRAAFEGPVRKAESGGFEVDIIGKVSDEQAKLLTQYNYR